MNRIPTDKIKQHAKTTIYMDPAEGRKAVGVAQRVRDQAMSLSMLIRQLLKEFVERHTG